MSGSSTKDTHGLVKFIGFGGLLALVAFAVSAGRYQQSIETTVVAVKDQQQQVAEVVTEIHVQQQELGELDRRITRQEDKK